MELMRQFILRARRVDYRKLWSDIKEAVSGTEQDFTEGNFYRAILLLSIPMVLEMVMESVFVVTDIFFISKLGADAVATVSLTDAVMTIIYAIGIGLSMTATAVVSRRIGEKKPKEAANAAVQSIYISIVISFFIGAIGIIFSKELLMLMGGSPTVVEEGHPFTAILIGSNVVIMLLFVINGILRSAGDAAISMKVLTLANIINIILDPCLIFGWGPFPELGLMGAAIATSFGRGTAVIVQFYILFKGKGRIKISVSQLKPDFKLIKELLVLSKGTIGQYIISTTSWIGLARIIAVFGSIVLAGYTVAIRIVLFFILPLWGLSNAAATLVGQNLGAKKVERAEKSVWITGYINMVLMSSIGILFILFPEFFINILTNDHAVIVYAIDCLRIVGFALFPYSLGLVLTQAFNGAGDSATPMNINFFCFWLFQVPIAWLLAIFLDIGPNGVYIAIALADTLLVIIGIILFKKGHWKTKEV